MAAIQNSSARNSRPHLLHNWGASLLTIAQKSYHQVETIHGPVGSITKTLASFMFPILHPIQRQLLVILSLIDDKIIYAEDLTIKVFPPSSFLFSILDEFALLGESLPGKFDKVTNNWCRIECDEEEEKKKKTVAPKEEAAGKGDELVLTVESEPGNEKTNSSSKIEEEIEYILEELEKVGKVIAKEEEEEEEEEGGAGTKGEVKEGEVVPIVDLFDESWGGNLI